jgi:hypothetical protein
MKSADSLARSYTESAIATLAEIMTDPWAKDADRIKAADSILDRGHGKPLAATITLPPSKLALQQLAAMSDDELMNVIRQPLPRLAAPAIEAEFEEVNPAPGPVRDPLLD